MPLYLYIHLFTISYPLLQSFERRIQYWRKWKALFPGIFITAIFFLVWDEIFTAQGIWGFNPDYLLGFYVGQLPLEEILFFITVPFASVFIYECVIYFLPRGILTNYTRIISAVLSVVLLVLSILFNENAYTFWTFLFTALFLALHVWINKKYMGDFYLAYLIHLIPFFIVNGVLTGSWINEPIVWYNDAENLGIRLGTIPIEDSIYGMLLLLMNITFYEYFKNKFNIKHINH